MKGSSSTFAITDTSNATTLAPAPYAAEREAKTAWQETSDELRGSGGQKYPEGAVEHETSREPYKTNKHSSEQETTSESKDSSEQETTSENKDSSEQETTSENKDASEQETTSDNKDLSEQKTTSENKHSSEQETTSDNHNPSTKPTAAASKETEDPDTGDINAANPTRSQISTNNNNNNDDQDPPSAPSAFAPQPATSKPKGTNITEGGFDDDNPDHNASFTAEIGTENDPGRLAEATFRQRGADIPGPGKGSKQTDVTADGQYDVLQPEQEL